MTFDRAKLADAYKALGRALHADESDTSDGLRLSWPEEKKWLHVRPSGTEPIVRLIAEGADKDSATDLLDQAAGVLHGLS